MKEELMTEVMQQMLPYLDNAQLKQLRQVMEQALYHYEVTGTEVKPEEDDSNDLIAMFIAAKRIEGCSEKTLKYYQTTIDAMVSSLGKNVRHILTEDLRTYLTDYQSKNQSSRVTIDNIRRILSSFFSWLEDEDYIIKSPVRRIHKVKTASSIKETYSDEDLEKMRDNCEELRDLAMIDMLASTGMRVGELVLLNRDDIDFAERECKVFGKGDKERMVYFDARTKLHLQEYLASRTDDNPALFVTLRAPHERIQIGGIEHRLREMGNHAYVIILTAYDSFSYAQSALRLGAVDFLLKPFHDGELEQAVQALRKRMELQEGEKGAAAPILGLKKGDKSKYVLQAMDYIGSHYSDPNITVGEIAQHLGLSEGHLSHTFKKETDYTLLNYLTRYRIHKAMELLRDCRLKVYEVAEQVGYKDITYFSTTFKKLVGMSPSEYQDTSI